jgi:hypothetical protein
MKRLERSIEQLECTDGTVHEVSFDLNSTPEEEPDEWDLKMIEEAKLENEGSTISMEERLKRCDLSKADIEV